MYKPFDLTGRVALVTGGIAVYLASAASAFHAGDEIMIDGGYWVF